MRKNPSRDDFVNNSITYSVQISFIRHVSLKLIIILINQTIITILDDNTEDLALLLSFVGVGVLAQCSVNIPGSERRDCYPWTGASQSACEARGCTWCDDSTGFPSCFYNDNVCPSLIAEGSRTDCLPEGGAKPDCLLKSCIWCESATAGVPWCFPDPSVSQGGSLCPSSIAESERIDCHPEPGASETSCLQRGCYWCSSTTQGAPWCFAPTQTGYRLVGAVTDTQEGYTATLERVNTPSRYGAEVQTIRVDVGYQQLGRLHIKISDPNAARHEVPQTIGSAFSKHPNPLYEVVFDTASPVFGFKVLRKSTGAVIFDTTIGGLVFSDQFLQIATRLDSPYVYGFGETEHRTLLHDMNWKTWGMYARDQGVTDSNLYGVHPFYLNIERSSQAHGVFIHNSNAQEVTLSPAPALTYRTIGGILDLYFFLGPTPDEVVQQYTNALGLPLMVPYWALGFQLSRWGYTTLDQLKEVVARMREYDIPHDVQYGDIDYMYLKRAFTYDPVAYAGLPQYVQELKQQGTRFVIIVDPGIANTADPGEYPPLDHGTQLDIWVKRPDGSDGVGEVWPGLVHYPDFSNPNTQTWYTQESIDFHQVVEYAAHWIDMNEPSNFQNGDLGSCANNQLNFPPYMPAILDRSLYVKTVCPDWVQFSGNLYNHHSLYGWSMAKMTLPAVRAATGKRSVAFSRSTFPGSAPYAQHWLGDNVSQWAALGYSLIGTMEFNMWGYPYVGPDICGFNGDTTEQLCQRWQQIGAFFPFARNHNSQGSIDQDPGVWPEVARVTRETLHIRYTLLPYLYTLMHYAHFYGSSVVRPLFFEFPADVTTYSIDDQILWGSYFLISPVTTQDTYSVNAYFPDAKWFSYYDGALVPARATFTTIDAPLDFIPLHIRGGAILPTQQPANSTLFSRNLPMGLIATLDDLSQARGELFWDDGESIDTFENGAYYLALYEVSEGALTSSVYMNGYAGVNSLSMDNIRVMGITAPVNSVTVNMVLHSSWIQDSVTRQLTITDLSLPLSDDFAVRWN